MSISVRTVVGSVAMVMALGLGIAWAAGDWSAARSKADDFKSKQQDLKKLAPDETRQIVAAICAADDDARRDVGRDISDRVSREVNDKMSDLQRLRDDANQLLDGVINDDNLKDNRDDAKRLKEDVATRWDTIERMSRSLRGSNHPVVAFMLDQGQKIHSEYQDDSNKCDASEVVLSSGKADCVKATGETCLVVEIKPNNSRAIGKGKDQLRGYVRDLNNEVQNPNSEVMKALINKKSDFSKCKSFEGRIDCYKLCPDINDDNEFREIRPDWSTGCS